MKKVDLVHEVVAVFFLIMVKKDLVLPCKTQDFGGAK